MLIKATCKRREIERLTWITFDEWLLVEDLNQAYEYVENKKHWTLLKIKIIEYTNVNDELKESKEPNSGGLIQVFPNAPIKRKTDLE